MRAVGGDGILRTVLDAQMALLNAPPRTFFAPNDIAFDQSGRLYVADCGNNTVWQIDADGGGRPAAGNGQRGFGSDGRPAALAQLSDPRAVAVGADYSIYIADTGNRRVRVVGPDVEFVGIEFTDDGLLVGDTPPLVLVDRPHPGRVEVGISFIGESALEGIDGSGLLGVLQLRLGRATAAQRQVLISRALLRSATGSVDALERPTAAQLELDIVGDFDGAGRLAMNDLFVLLEHQGTAVATSDEHLDLTGDGQVNRADIAVWYALFRGPPRCLTPLRGFSTFGAVRHSYFPVNTVFFKFYTPPCRPELPPLQVSCRRLCAAVLCLCSTAWVACQPQPPELAPGVVHHPLHLSAGPWSIHVIEVDLAKAAKAGVRLRSARAELDEEGEGLAKTSAMAAQALAGINGDFFFTDGLVRPAGLQICDGKLLQLPQRRTAFVLEADGSPLISVFQFQAGLIAAGGEILPIVGFNSWATADGLTLYNYYGQMRADSVYAALGLQLQSLDSTATINDTVAARVLQIRRRGWPLLLNPDQWVVAIGGDYPMEASIAPGDTVQLYRNLLPASGAVSQAIGGGPRIIRDGEISIEHAQENLDADFASQRHPRSAVGYSRDRDTLFLVAVDGRQPGYSVGMNLEELAQFMRYSLVEHSVSKTNAYQALNLDGGGSTTMVVQGKVANRPSDQTGERLVANALLVVDEGK